MGFTCIDNDVILSPDLSHGAFRCYAVLRYHARQADYAFPSEETLAKELGVTARTVRNYLKELEGQGLIRREKNVYFFEQSGMKNSSEDRKIISMSRKNISENPGKNFPIEEKEKEKEVPAPAHTHAHTHEERPNAFRLFEENINPMTPFYAEQLKDMAKEYSDLWLEMAIKTAAFRNIRKVSYIAGILKGWKEKGYNPPPEIIPSAPPPPSRAPDPHCPKCGGEGYTLYEVFDEKGNTIAANYPQCDCWRPVLQAAAAD